MDLGFWECRSLGPREPSCWIISSGILYGQDIFFLSQRFVVFIESKASHYSVITPGNHHIVLFSRVKIIASLQVITTSSGASTKRNRTELRTRDGEGNCRAKSERETKLTSGQRNRKNQARGQHLRNPLVIIQRYCFLGERSL